MTSAAWVTLVVVCGFVWGGALAFVGIALRKERRKAGEPGAEEAGGLWVP